MLADAFFAFEEVSEIPEARIAKMVRDITPLLEVGKIVRVHRDATLGILTEAQRVGSRARYATWEYADDGYAYGTLKEKDE